MITTAGTTPDQAARPRALAFAVFAALVSLATVTGCSGDDTGESSVPSGTPATIALGELPAALAAGAVPVATVDPDDVAATTTTTTTVPQLDGPVGDAVDGNRLLMIGDELFASAAPRNGGIACDVLTSFGWDVEIDAEPGRYVDFAATVLDARLDPDQGLDWDAVAIFLGNLFDGDVDEFETELDSVLDRLAPRPVVLYTLTGDDRAIVELDAFIRTRGDVHPNIAVVDWAQHVADEADRELLADGGPALTEEGSGRIIVLLAGVLNRAPAPPAPVPDGATSEPGTSEPGTSEPDAGGTDAAVGECLEPAFADDSAIVL